MKHRLAIRFLTVPILAAGLLAVGLLAVGYVSPAEAEPPRLELRKGDHVSIIGNTLADRMQHDGWLETRIQQRFPQHQLVFRNLGYPGDEVDIRPRSENFGSPDQWLTKTDTDVVFAFFGYNESLAGESGLPAFRKRLAAFIDATFAQRYNSESPPRLVLFSPIAHEDLRDPNLPDGKASNARLLEYTQAMAEVAAEKGVPFVDLFNPTRSLYATAKRPLTMNGIHLTTEGNRQVAEVIDRQLFGPPAAGGGESPEDRQALEKLRAAVVDKNFHWFSRYRTVDEYNVFGGRSKLAWFGQSNADVMMREMEIFDVMTANRDKRVWALAAGGDLQVDDSNTPPLQIVQTNKPGPLEGGKFPFLGGEEAIDRMTIAEGMQVNLFASEEQFPELANPVQMSVDSDGRLWVATWPTYPHWNPKEELRDKLVILPDEDGDGKADRLIVFADGLNSVTGFEFWGGGVLVAAAPEILFLKDTDGDDKADVKIRMLQGVSSADSHHTANSLVVGPDGGLYYSRGIFNVANMETPTKTFRSSTSGVYRFDPRTFEIDFVFPIGPNPHGDAIDQWGYQFASDGTSGTGSYINIGKGVGAPKQWYQKRVRPVPATGFLSSSHFPEANNGNFLICNAIGVLGVLQHKVQYDGADINAVEIEPLLLSSDPNFRPTDIEVGGDGALYISDWCNPLIGHMQHNIRDPNRDHQHGRVYRMTAKGRALLKPVKLRGKPIPTVLEAFYAKENGTRYRARLELSGRDRAEVMQAVADWTTKIEPTSPADEQALLEALWVCEEQRVPNEELLAKVFRSREPRVRAAAIRTLGHWGPRIKDWQPLLLAAARDDEPLVRAEAVKAAVSFDGLAAAEAIFEAGNRPTDVQLDFVLDYARKQIDVDRVVQDALKSGAKLSLAAQTYVLRNASVDDLLKMERTEAVYAAILARANVPETPLKETIDGLAKLRKTSPLELLLTTIERQDADERDENLATLARLLASQPVGELRAAGERLKKLALSGKLAGTRKAGYAAWIQAAGSADEAFTEAVRTKASLREALESVALVASDELRAGMFDRVRPLISELPPNLASEGSGASLGVSGIHVEYFHPNGPDVAIETLDRMKPKASGIVPEITMEVPQLQQRDQFALRFTGSIQIDKSGKYTFFVSSDDGSRLYIGDQLVVNNDGLHGMVEKSGTIPLSVGLHPITVTYFDNGGGDGLSVAWSGPGMDKKQPIPASVLSVEGEETLHDVAIRTLSSIPGFESQKFDDLAALIQNGRNRTSAIRAILEIPAAKWNQRRARALADTLVAYVSEIPAKYRTGPAATDAVKLAGQLAALLPSNQAEAIRDRLNNLDVRVIAIGTVPHRMIYDKERMVVEAGKPVEFRFSNIDNMPHNFTIVLPGAMEEVGLLAEATAMAPDAMERQYIPKSDKILLGSRLLQPGESQAISYEAPKTPGVYPYVCTYPGHWRRMYGALYVVENLEQYQADPQAYLASHPLPVKDDLLKLVGQSREWSIDELLEFVTPLQGGRSFEVGQNAFKVSNCVGCHRMGSKEGPQVGPDLTKLDPMKRTAEHVLRSLITPSDKIEEKFQSHVFELDSGKIVTGMILEETPDSLTVIDNPLAQSKPLVIKKSSIEFQQKSPKSIMPEGLAGKLTREEILDLIAYVLAAGDKKHALFEMHHHH